MKDKTPDNHYVSDKQFTANVIEYLAKCNDHESRGLEAPVIPRIIADDFIKLANKLGTRYNFIGYSFRDEMVSSAIYACCNKIRKFNVDIKASAYTFFSKVCWRAMVDVINAEEKHSYIKAKTFNSIDFDMETVDDTIDFGGEPSTNATADFMPYFDIQEYENKIAAQKLKTKMKTIPESTKREPTDAVLEF